MKIRSITYFCNPGWLLDEKKITSAGKFLSGAKTEFERAGFEVQSVRLATVPFSTMLGAAKISETPILAVQMSQAIQETGIDYAALGPAIPDIPESYTVIPPALAASKNVFFSAIIADTKRGISLLAIKACAEVIVKVASLDPNGFTNLNFAALANVRPGVPFFPAAYHGSRAPAFALATEAADLAVTAFENATTLAGARKSLIASIEENSRRMEKVANRLNEEYKIKFRGIDFSFAPFPEEARSIGAAFETMGVPKVGLHGSLAAAAILTESIEGVQFPRAGFNGLMMPVLEDAVLAKRAEEGTLAIKDLLLYSAVCGTGLDTVPIPGDASAGQIAALLLDLSALALRLNKPLTARLMPVPGKHAGDPTSFDFGFFRNSRVMALDAMPVDDPLDKEKNIILRRRKYR